jgi:hypothetical protein
MKDKDKDDATLDDAALHALAGTLGARAAERLDVDATAAAVLERLRNEPEVARFRWTQPAWLRIAAAAIVLLGGVLVARQLIPGGDGRHGPAHFVSDDLRGLSADQLREVLSTLDETLDLGRTTVPEPDLEDLDAQQLRAVLRSLEG